MKAIIALLLCLTVAFAIEQSTVQSFIEFQHKYGKFYTSAEEFNYRLAVFNSNIKAAAKMQESSNETTFGITKFMDLTPKEFKTIILMSKMPPRENIEGHYNPKNATAPAPSSYDWRNRAGVVTPVYNQGQCGSCWAFSATENIESQWALAGHPLESLSMQQVVSCDTTTYGCSGGWTYLAYQYVISAGGIESYSAYPYNSGNGNTGSCEFNRGDVAATLGSWSYVTQNQNEQQMVDYLVSTGPLSICVDAAPWQYYTGGVLLASSCSTSIDHCVEAIGYNLNSNPPYWIVRNSWGADWGIAGYIYLQYGQNTCALAEVVTMSHPN